MLAVNPDDGQHAAIHGERISPLLSAKTGNVAPLITSADPHPANPEHSGTRNKAEASKWTVTRPHLRGLVDAVPAQGFGKAALIDIPDLRARG